MEITLLIVLILLLVLNIILGFVFRKRETDPGLKTGIDSLNGNLGRIEANLKADFRLNREENAALNRENRAELGISLKEFTHELRRKFDELKAEQKELATKTLESLEKITAKVEEKLDVLAKQAADGNKEMREATENVFKQFAGSFDKNVASFNELQREKFGQLDEKQQKLIEITGKPALGIALTALIFSITHFEIQRFFAILLLGGVLGLLFYWTKNLWVPIAAHFLNNGAQVIIAWLNPEKINELKDGAGEDDPTTGAK